MNESLKTGIRSERTWTIPASTVRSIAPPARSCLQNAARWTAAETGDAKLTQGYRLPARFVIHTVYRTLLAEASG